MWQSPPVQIRSPTSRSHLLREHVREERVARDVERHAEEDVRASLVDLAAQLAVRDVELEERVARRQRHLRELGHVPGADDDPARVGLLAEQADGLGDLVDVPPSGVGQLRHWTPYTGPRSPFSSAHSSQIVTPCSCSERTFPSPRRNQRSSFATDGKCTFFVVTSGKPSARSKRIW